MWIILSEDRRNDNIHFSSPCKWYDWKEDMEDFSLKFPDFLFIVTGNGDSNNDLWKAYFYAGKCIYIPAVITYRTPDKDELKDFNCPYMN